MLDGHKLTKALVAAQTSPLETRMALVLWKVNGIDSALEYVQGLKDGRGRPVREVEQGED